MMNISQLVNDLSKEWQEIFSESDIKDVQLKLNENIENFSPLRVFPPRDLIFTTFSYIQPQDINVVIIGQDCYHKEGQALGVSFGVPNRLPYPPSLRNIQTELKNDLNLSLTDSDLIYLNRQGVLLINCALTVRESCPGSHLNIWKPFVVNLINIICNKNKGLVFLLWGNFAKNIKKNITKADEHYFLEANHPSPLSANKGGWFGCKHFSKTNQILKNLGKKPIEWGN